jgi:hypothetical protein
MEIPGSYFVFDPGRTCGWASCLPGGKNLRHGTWRFRDPSAGATYFEFSQNLRRVLDGLPDPLVGIELMTIVGHGEDNRVDAQQVLFSSGWTSIAQTVCHSLALREPQLIAIQTWRSKTHGKVYTPKNLNLDQNARSKWFKVEAKKYCDRNGWSYNTEDEAEALCMLDYLRIEHEPTYAFDKGRSYQQESFL